MKVVWRPAALTDLRRLIIHIALDNPHAAVRMSRRLREAADRLCAFPYQGRPGVVPDTRELVTIRPYIIVYKAVLEEDSVIILRIWHAAQARLDGGPDAGM